MRAGGSWQVRESDEQMLHVLLHTRDALGLDVDGPGVPPRLLAVPAAIGGPVAGRETAQAWTAWWRDHVSLAVVLQGFDLPGDPALAPWARQLPPAPVADDLQARVQWHQVVRSAHDVGTPPDFAGVGDPTLRMAATQAWPVARSRKDVGPRTRSGRRGHLGQELVREVAEDVAFDLGRDLASLDALVLPLDVSGSWWHVWAPGVVLCSSAAAAEPGTARPLLRAAFTSRI